MGRVGRSGIGERCAAAALAAQSGNAGQLGDRRVVSAAAAAGQIGWGVFGRPRQAGGERSKSTLASIRLRGSGQAARSGRIGPIGQPWRAAVVELARPGAATVKCAASGDGFGFGGHLEDRVGWRTVEWRVAVGCGSAAGTSGRPGGAAATAQGAGDRC